MYERLQQEKEKRKTTGTFQTSIAFYADMNHLEYSSTAGQNGR
jgi:hypothetical protein